MLRRDPDGPVGGVATGIANYFEIDPVIIQVGVVCLGIASLGAGSFAYLAAWVLIPERDTSSSTARFAIKDSISTSSIVALMVAGLVIAGVIGDQSTSLIVPGILVAGGFYFLNQRSAEHAAFVQPPPAPRTPPPPTAAASADPYGWAVPRVDGQTLTTPQPPKQEKEIPEPEPDLPAAPTPPITAVTLGIVAGAIALLALLNGLFNIGLGAAVFIGMAITIIGGGMVVASVVGRARALIPLGLLSVFTLIASPIVDAGLSGGFGPREITVRNESALQSEYTLGAGYFELDLRPLTLTENRTVTIDVGAGAAEIRVPSDMNVEIIATNDAGYVGVVAPAVPGEAIVAGEGVDPIEPVDPIDPIDGTDFDESFEDGFDEEPNFSIETDTVTVEIPPRSGLTWTSEEIAGTDNDYRWSQVVNDGPTLTLIVNVSYGALEVTR